MCPLASSRPPPILTRAFDEIDQCVAKFSQGEKLSRVPLPAQYAATLSIILIIHGCVTPAAMINIVGASYQAVMAAALVTFMLWSVHRLAEILENPFDFWASDLNLKVLHSELNEKLRLGCGVPSQGRARSPCAAAHCCHAHRASGEPDWSEIETKVQNAEVGDHTHVLH